MKEKITINDFNKPEQQLIKELSENCKMELEEVIDALFDTENLGTGISPSLIENGNLKTVTLSPRFYKLKALSSISFLPYLKDFYLCEDYRKTRANHIKKLHFPNCSNLKVISISGSKLEELVIDAPYLEALILRTPNIRKCDTKKFIKLGHVEIDGITEFDMSQFNLEWHLLKVLSIKNMSQDIPIEKLKSIQKLTLNYLKDISAPSVENKMIRLEAADLESVELSNTNIKALDLKDCPKLKELSLTEKKLEKLLFDYSLIEKIDIYTHKEVLTLEKINGCKKLKDLRIVDCYIENFNVQLDELFRIYLVDPKIKLLDVTSCHRLNELSVTGAYGEIEKIKMHCDYIELNLNNVSKLKELDISASLDSAYLEYTVNRMNIHELTLICRDTQLERHEWLRKDFSNIKTIVSSGKELEKMVEHYNHDQGDEFLNWVIEHPNCDRGTALKVYWRLGAAWYSQYENEGQVPSHAEDGYKLIKKIERLYTSDYFKKCGIVYEPEKDFIDCYADVMVKERIPYIMFLCSNETTKGRDSYE